MEEAKQEFTKDGSVDLRGRPAIAARTGRWKACSFLVGYEAFERMAFYGVASNLVVYLTTELREDTVSSVRNVNNWTGSVWMTPIAGAYIADAYLGRFWTFTFSSLLYLTGMILTTLAVSLKALRPQCTPGGGCEPATRSQVAFFYAALYTIAIGAGGTKPNISTFGADQFDDLDARESRTKASFFNWWMFSSFTGGLVAVLVLVYVQENVGWGIGYTIPTVGLALSLILFYVGTPFYRHKPVHRRNSANAAGAGPVRLVGRVFRAAFANRRRKVITGDDQFHEHDAAWYAAAAGTKRRLHRTAAFRFLDKAALVVGEESPVAAACTVTEVEEVKLVVGMVVVWLTTLVPCTIWAQVNTLFVKQGATLDRAIGRNGVRIPAASLGSFITISMLLSIPVYDRVLVPLARRRTGDPRGITLLQRLGVGCALQVAAVACACLVELRRMRVIRHSSLPITRGGGTVPMSIFWMLPQYVLIGVGDVFNSVGILEFFYDQSPQGMQSLGTTFFTSGLGVGNFLNSLLVTAVDRITRRGGAGKSWIGDNLNDSHLDYYYVFLLLLAVINLAVFVWVASRYEYKKEYLLEDDGTASRETEMAAAGGKGKVVERSKVIDAPLVAVEDVRAV
uniref:Major facilitator superfamily (MFS) profile domain-containing protein n=1 Tax=Leersia perrieri TaxID=77586 RepID=A0A0D9WF89_9ORYZ